MKYENCMLASIPMDTGKYILTCNGEANPVWLNTENGKTVLVTNGHEVRYNNTIIDRCKHNFKSRKFFSRRELILWKKKYRSLYQWKRIFATKPPKD